MVVFCDGVMVINFVASVMMNGVCCLHQMQHEEERKQEYHDALRRAMKVEWQRHRLMEQELEEQRRRTRGVGIDGTTSNHEAEERRRLLMTAKQKATSSAAGSAASSVSSLDQGATFGVPAVATATNGNSILDGQDRFTRVNSGTGGSYKMGDVDGRSTISLSSLLDNEDDDDEEEEDQGEFENVDLV